MDSIKSKEVDTIKKIRVLFLAFLLVAPIYGGNIYYIDKATGNDSNPGTQLLPWRTIQKAANNMVAGDKVIVKDGTYSERVSATTSGTPGNEITYQVNTGDTVTCKGFTISGNYVTVDGFIVDADDNDNTNGRGFYVSSDYVTVKNCFATECPRGGIFFDQNSSSGYIYSNRCYHNGQNGIEVWGSYHRVENNEIWESVQHHPQAPSIGGADADGVRFHGDHHTFIRNWIHEPALMSDPYNTDPHIDCFQTFDGSSYGAPTASYCTFEKNRCRQYTQGINSTFMIEGSQLYPPHHIAIKDNIFEVVQGININSTGGGNPHDIYVYNNNFIGDISTIGGSALLISNASNIEIINNITVDYKANHRYIVGCTNVILNNNCAYNTDGSAPAATPSPQTLDLWAIDPRFVSISSRDYHLQASSPCINAGASISEVTDDFDGNLRPQGASWDIGAYEYVLGSPPAATISASPTSGQAPLAVNFTGSATGGAPPYSYSWAFGDGGTSTIQNPFHTYTASGNFTVNLTLTDSTSANASTSVTIAVGSTSSASLALAAETGAPAPGQGGTTDPPPGNYPFSIGSSVKITSIPVTDYRFSKWSGDIDQLYAFNAAPTVTMDKNRSLAATFCAKCADVNGDLKITPGDAQMAFDIYLGRIAAPTWCELENADVNCSGTKLSPKVTPADAQAIFNKYINKGVVNSDCSGNSRTASLSLQPLGLGHAAIVLNTPLLVLGEDIRVPVIVESSSSITAFGFDLAFSSDALMYVGLEATELTKDYALLGANVLPYEPTNPDETGAVQESTPARRSFSLSASKRPGSQPAGSQENRRDLGNSAIGASNLKVLRVGGYTLAPSVSSSSGVLVTLVFRVVRTAKVPNPMSVIATYDDIRNAAIKN
jgi:PKD repeat protein